MRRLLVTGGTGFIGAHLARIRAAAGDEVLVVGRDRPGPEATFILGPRLRQVGAHAVDVRDAVAVGRLVDRLAPDVVVHLAADVDPVRLARDPSTAAEVNLGGTLHLLEAARRVGVQRFILFSSVGAIAPVAYEPIDADHPVIRARSGPGSGFYGAAKVAAEAFALAYVDGFGLDVRIVRPSAVYGFGMRNPIYVKPMVESSVRGEPVSFPTGGAFPRDYTHVLDVASLTSALIDAPDNVDRVFYAATGNPLVTTREVAALVCDLIPGASVAIADDLSESDRVEITYRGRIAMEPARSQLGWTPRFDDLKAGLAEYIATYRAYLGRLQDQQANAT